MDAALETILSPPKCSLSPTRGDSSLSQLFCSLFFDVCIVYVMFQLRRDWEKAWLSQKWTYSCVWGIDWVLFHHVDHVQTCTIDTTMLIMYKKLPLGVDKLFCLPPNAAWVQYEVILLCPSSFCSFLLTCMGFICCFDYVLNDRRLRYWINCVLNEREKACVKLTGAQQ